MISGIHPKEVTDAQLQEFADLIYRRAGIRISPQKKMLLSNRLRRRLKETGITCFGEYYKHLKQLKPTDPEWDAFLQEITTHETYLFRDERQWDWFRNVFLADIAAEARARHRTESLRIWSAACSTGDEPVTIACCIAACLPNFQKWKIHILGTDIGVGALEQAKAAEFGERAMRMVPDDYKNRFFTKVADKPVWRARPILTGMLSFRQHNLMLPLSEKSFDLVFLKNVLIYFDAASKDVVIEGVRKALRPGGLLVAGAAENVAPSLKDFQRMEAWLFRKPSP